MARLRSVGISPVFREALYSSSREWTRLLLHRLRSVAGNSSGPPEEFCKIVFIASMMSSLVILMSDSVFPCGWPAGGRLLHPGFFYLRFDLHEIQCNSSFVSLIKYFFI